MCLCMRAGTGVCPSVCVCVCVCVCARAFIRVCVGGKIAYVNIVFLLFYYAGCFNPSMKWLCRTGSVRLSGGSSSLGETEARRRKIIEWTAASP